MLLFACCSIFLMMPCLCEIYTHKNVVLILKPLQSVPQKFTWSRIKIYGLISTITIKIIKNRDDFKMLKLICIFTKLNETITGDVDSLVTKKNPK